MIDLIDHGKVRELRLARPPANAFNPALVAELARRITAAPQEGAEAIVISGAPGLFTGGLDVPELLTLDREQMRAFFRAFYGLLRDVAASEIPIAAAITGHSPAAGAVLAVFCDHRVMAEGRYKIGMNEVQVGLAVPPMLQYAMKRLVGPRQGDALLVAGALVSPDEALRIGLVDAVVPVERVVPAAIEWAEGLVALPRAAMRDTRRSARADLAAQFRDLGDASYDEAAARWFGEETRQTMRALVERLGKR
jgi:enoyl-CoA hydratase/carnithine racemase